METKLWLYIDSINLSYFQYKLSLLNKSREDDSGIAHILQMKTPEMIQLLQNYNVMYSVAIIGPNARLVEELGRFWPMKHFSMLALTLLPD